MEGVNKVGGVQNGDCRGGEGVIEQIQGNSFKSRGCSREGGLGTLLWLIT